MQGEASASGTRYPDVTVLYADLSGFTALSEKLDPEEVTDAINRCFEALEQVVVTHGGMVQKYLGDCLVALFGLTPATPAPAAQATRAALALRETLADLSTRGGLPAPLGIHIGINTGPVIAATIGTAAKHEFAVLGDTVELATRLEDASATGQIFVGPATYDATRGEFDYRPADPVAVGTPPHAVAVYELLGLQPERHVRRGSERRVATVVFADFLGFGALAARIDDSALARLLDDCLAEMADAVTAHGGVVDKYIGEGLMALFGVPNAIEHAPVQAVRAVLDMRQRLARFCAHRDLGAALDLHVGVNTGLVIAGEIGGRLKRDFTAIGDAVNVAARLKDAAARGVICVGAETYRYTRDHFDFEPPAPLSLKGKTQPVQTYAVRAAIGGAHTRPAATAERVVFSELVGRQRELAAMRAQLDQLLGGRGGVISLSGEAGIGKSRLLAEFERGVADLDVALLAGPSLAVGQNLGFHPFATLLRRWAGIGEDEPETAAGAKLLDAVAALFDNGTIDVFPFLARLMGMQLGGPQADRLAAMEGDALEHLILKAMRDLLLALAARRPVLVVFDDLHWADPSSVNLLEALVPLAAEGPILFINVYRPQCPETAEHITAVARRTLPEHHLGIELEGLNAADTDRLLNNLLDLADLPRATRAAIAARADGNPFYVEEVVRSLVDQGAVEFRDGRFRVTAAIDRVVIPATIQEVIMARVDRLDESARQLLQVASVIGRSFYHRIIAAVLEREGGLEAELDDLRAKQLVYAREARWAVSLGDRGLAEELEYVFKHALAQETIYESLLRKTRKDLHRRVAQVIQALFDDRVPDFYGMLAYHSTRAEDFANAHEYLFRAGEGAARSAATTEALSFFRQAAAMYDTLHGDGGDPHRKALLEKHIALGLLNTGELPESIPHFDRALEHLGERVPKPGLASYGTFAMDMTALLARLYLGLRWRRAVADWERERVIDEVKFNRARAEITSDPVRLFFDSVAYFRHISEMDPSRVDQACSIYASAAGMFCYSGLSFTIGRRILVEARKLVRTGSVRDRFTCASMEFICDYLAGEWSDRHVVDEDLLAEALRFGQLWDINTYVGLYCDRLTRQGDFAKAQAMLDRLDALAIQYAFAFAEANRDGQTALFLIEQRRIAEALPIAQAYAASRQEDALRVHGLGLIAKAHVLDGDTAAAEECFAVLGDILRRSPPVSPWHQSAYVVARLRFDVQALEQSGDTEARRRQASRSVRYALRVAGKVAVPRTEVYQLVGRLQWARGRPAAALRWWRRSVEAGTRLNARPELARTFLAAAQRLETRPALRLDGLDAAACRARAAALYAEVGLALEPEATTTAAAA